MEKGAFICEDYVAEQNVSVSSSYYSTIFQNHIHKIPDVFFYQGDANFRVSLQTYVITTTLCNINAPFVNNGYVTDKCYWYLY